VPDDAGVSNVLQLSAERGVPGAVYRPDDAQIAAASAKLLGEPMTPASAVQLALVNSRRLQATFESFGVSQARYINAVTPTNPVLDIDLKLARGESPKWDVSILQSLIELLKLPAERKIAAAELTAAKYRAAEAVLELAKAVRLATIDAQAAEAMQGWRRQIAEAASITGDFANRLNKAGNLSVLLQTVHRAEAAQAELDVSDAALDVTLARERLARVIGLDDPTAIRLAPLADTVAEPVPEDAAKTIETQNLSLLAMKQQLLAAGERAGIARATAWVDQLDVGATAERDAPRWYVGPAFSVSLPVFSQGQAQRLLADATVRMQLQSYLADRVELRSDVRQALAMLERAGQRLQAYQKSILPLRREVFHQTQLYYNAMFNDVFGLMQAKQGELQADLATTLAWRDYWHARTEVEHLLAGGSAASATPSIAGMDPGAKP